MALAGFVIRFLAVTAGFAVLHYYLWWRLCRDTTEKGSRWRPIGAVVLGALALLGLLARFFTPSGAPMWFQSLAGWPGLIWFGMFLYLFGLLVVGELLRWMVIRRRGPGEPGDELFAHLRALANRLRPKRRPEPEPTPDPAVHTRRKVLSRAIGIGSAAVATATVGAGLYEGYRTPRLKPVSVVLPRLDRRFDGYRIAVVGDTHFSAIRGRGYCERIVDQVNRAQADLIAFVGDLASNEAEQIREATDPLARLQSRDGAFFVAGNAEHYVGADAWYDRVAELGMTGLPNTRVELPGFDLAGINDLIVDQRGIDGETGPDFEAALGDRDPARPLVFMAHQPNAIEGALGYGVDLQLSGHTHGGQMWPVHYASRIRSGQLTGLERHGDAQVYVTNGAGTNGPPIRVGAASDITVMTLRAPA